MLTGAENASAIRSVMRETAEAYTDPAFDTNAPPDVDHIAAMHDVTLDQLAHNKVRRYALATAAVHFLMNETVKGEGPAAQFRHVQPAHAEHMAPLTMLQSSARNTIRHTSTQLQATHRAFRYALETYIDLSQDDPQAAISEEAEILDGGNLPGDGASLVGVTANAMEAHAFTRQLDGRRRAAIAHGLLSIVTGRASKHLDVFMFTTPHWEETIARGVKLAPRGQAYALVQPDGSKLFSIPADRLQGLSPEGPLLKCPAHQRLHGARYTALEQGLHATINLAHTYGMYEIPYTGQEPAQP